MKPPVKGAEDRDHTYRQERRVPLPAHGALCWVEEVEAAEEVEDPPMAMGVAGDPGPHPGDLSGEETPGVHLGRQAATVWTPLRDMQGAPAPVSGHGSGRCSAGCASNITRG